jgi:hypothetical protein
MNDGTNLNLLGRPARAGRPSNLALYRQYWRTKEIITTLPGAQVNCAEWFQLYGGYIFRTFSTGETTEFFNIPNPMRTHIKDRLERITTSLEVHKGASKYNPADAQLTRWFEPPENRKLELQVPPLHLSCDQWERAVLLAKKLMYVARRRPYLVSDAVLGYCYAATTHRHVILTDKKDAEYGELLFDLVKELHLGELAIQYVGFRAGSRKTDVEALRQQLGLPPADADYETTNNLDSPARLNHIGIKLCWGDSHRASPAWHQVAVLAAITELWRCVSRPDGLHRFL